ncbi:MAG: SprT-like domain-containing protein [Gemmatimonadota bacterium]
MRSRSAPAHSVEDGQFDLALELAPEEALPDRLFRLGLPPGTDVTLTRNRTVLVSHHARFGLRLHAGYAWAPDDVLAAIILFLKPRVPRASRLAARRTFLGFPVDRHVPSRHRPRRERVVPSHHAAAVARLLRLHEILNGRHFGGLLATVPITISDKMRSRLGEFRADHDGRSREITLSSRHIRRDGWPAASETLLHEMVHQWQCETGLPLDHGTAFRRKAREVGISPHARAVALPSATDSPGTIE